MRLGRLALLAVVSLSVIAGTAPHLAAEELYSKEDNFNIALPAGWLRETSKASWEKDGIKVGARRQLEKLDNGKPAQNEGGQMHMSRQPAPEGKSLADLAADPLQREFLLRFFGEKATWPEVDVRDTTVKGEVGEVPAVLLTAEGQGVNPFSGNASKVYGQLLLVISKKHLQRLRVVAWTTPNDEEGLHFDLDRLCIDFQLVDASVEKPKEERPKQPDDPGVEEKPQGDSAEEKIVASATQGWRFVKPKGLMTRELDRVKNPNTEAAIGGSDAYGYAEFVLSVYENGKVVNGRQTAPQDIRKWSTTSWWQMFTSLCPLGAVETFPWPKQKPNASFLTVPDLDKPDVLVAADKKRPVELSDSDILRKLPFVEEAKGTIGAQKVSEGFRGAIRGNRKDVGPEVTLRFAWRTPKWTYMLSATVGREGAKKYAPLMRQLLESFEIEK